MEVTVPDTNIPALSQLATTWSPRLRPAVVAAVLRNEVEVETEDGRLLARLAVPTFYRPAVTDTVLLIESIDAAYVIGVLEATGPIVIESANDPLLCAPNGHINIDATAIQAKAAELRLESGCLSLLAAELRETFGSVRRVVHGLFEIDVGSIRTRARELFSVTARRVRAAASLDVKIDGERIHLG
jgi:hypothetical protein